MFRPSNLLKADHSVILLILRFSFHPRLLRRGEAPDHILRMIPLLILHSGQGLVDGKVAIEHVAKNNIRLPFCMILL